MILSAIHPVLVGFIAIGLGIAALILTSIAYSRVKLATNLHFRHWLYARWGWGKDITELARRLDIPGEELKRFEPKYSEARIPKRGGGSRQLLIPSRETKQLQRRVLRRLLKRLNAHEAACGFERGKSIVDNARPHAGKRVVIRLDLVDFFPSTTAQRVEAYFRRIGWNAEAAALLTRLTTHAGGLPQGAPTSPRLSNLVNFYLDVQLTRLAARYRGEYTRYADDITYSFPRDYPRRMRGIVQKTRWILKHRGYQINDKKLRILRRHQRQTVTGLVVNDHPQLSRETRRWLRAVRHHVRTGRPITLSPEQLVGWTAFELMTLKEQAPPPQS